MPASECKINEPAPSFNLSNADGKTVSLEDFRGKQPVLLIFYPGDFTPGCTVQLCAIRDDWKQFEQANVAVFGINHADALSHKQFSDEHHFPFPLLIDPHKRASKKFGAVRSLFGTIVIRRIVVGIDAHGVVRYYRKGMPKNSEILKALKTYA